MHVLHTGWLTDLEKWCLVYWEDEESVTCVPEKDVEDCTVGVKTVIRGKFTGEIAAIGKLLRNKMLAG